MMKEIWSKGRSGGCIVSNVKPERTSYIDEDFNSEKEYYGGYLIAESIPDMQKLNVLVAAPEMLEVLETIENDNGQVPEWLFLRIKSVINKANGNV